MINRDNLAILTPDNIHRIKPLAYLDKGNNKHLTQLHFNPDNFTLTSVGVLDKKVWLWNLQTQSLENEIEMQCSPQHTVLSSCGTWIASTKGYIDDAGEIYIRNLKTGEPVFSKESGVPLLFTPDRRFFLYAFDCSPYELETGQCALQVYKVDLETWREELFLSLPYGEEAHFDTKCWWYARIVQDQISIMEFSSHRLCKTLFSSNEPVLSVVFSPDGKYVLGISYPVDELWELETGQKITQFDQKAMVHINFSPDSRFLAYINFVWNLAGQSVQSHIHLEDAENLRKQHVTFNISDTLFFAIYPRKTDIFELVSGRKLKTLTDVRCLAFSPDDKLIAAEADKGVICLLGIE